MATVSVTNTTAALSAKTLAILESIATITALWTFDRGANAPFAVAAASTKVTNLDADKLDGLEASYLLSAANHTGVPYVKSEVSHRLTLTTGVPVTTGDVTGATTLYFTPYVGNTIALYTGSAWVIVSQSQLSIAVPATTSQMYDVFVDYNSGTPQLNLTAWTNDTTRATALTTQDGVLVKTGSTGLRFVGCMRTGTVSGQTEDSASKRFVWNYYNRVDRPMRVVEATDSWNYTTATWRQANGAAANQLAFIIGVSEDLVDADVLANSSHSAGVQRGVAIGHSSTTTPSGRIEMSGLTNAAGEVISHHCRYRGAATVGYQYLAWLEYSTASGTTTWRGDNGSPTILQSGIEGAIRG